MPIKGQDWEILIERQTAQKNGSRVRTVGRYQVFHNGAAVPELSGTTAESKGQGTNAANLASGV